MCDKDSNMSFNESDSDMIVHEPLHDVWSEECWKCWTMPKIRFKGPVKIENPKYCWLYPRKSVKKLKKVVPDFEHCETLYTDCDYKLEACAHIQILKVEEKLKFCEKLFKKEIMLQRELIERLWELSFRFMVLRNSSCCVKFYPEIISKPTERRILCEFHGRLRDINFSNCRLSEALGKARKRMEELDRRCAQLDMTVESYFIIGNGNRSRPLAYIREMLSDIFRYFYSTLCKLKCWCQLIDPADTPGVEDYKSLLLSLDDFNGFFISQTDECTCFRTHKRDCIKSRKPCDRAKHLHLHENKEN